MKQQLYNMKLSKNWFFGSSKGARLAAVALALLSLSACQDDFGGYYNQPAYVSSFSNEVLKSRGDCQNYLKLVNKTLFRKQIEGSGQYTFLVPTDDAFNAFFANNPYGYKSVDDIPEDVASRMVSSWMMYNSYPCDTLANVLDGFNTWNTNVAFKHMTPSYDVLLNEQIDGKSVMVRDMPYTEFTLFNNAPSWTNNRFLSVFTKRFVNNNSITSDDWQKVVGSEFSPYGNYVEAGIIDAGSGAANVGDLYCQNGVIHLVDKVVMPLDNLDAMIRTYGDESAVDQPSKAKKGAWALLRNMLYHKTGNGEYSFLWYQENATAKHYYEKAYPKLNLENFYIRRYRAAKVPFNLNVERYFLMQNMYSTLSDCFYTDYNGGMTFYVPEKQVLLDYINNRLFHFSDVKITENTTQAEFDAAFNKLSENVITTLWASMQADGMMWPSQFESSAVNSVGSSEHINGYDEKLTYDNGVLAAGIASNGMWQITNFVPKTAAFEGVASRFLLDPAYALDENLITGYYANSLYSNMLKSKLAGLDDVDLSLVLWGNANATWWDNVHYSTLLSSYANGTVGNETSVINQLRDNLLSGYIERNTDDPLDFEVDPLNGAYGGWAYTNNYLGQVIRYRKSGKMIDGKPEIQIQTPWHVFNDQNERAMKTSTNALVESGVPATLQVTEPTEGCYTSVVKDDATDYVNGHVYLTANHSVPLYYAIQNGVFGDGKIYYTTSLSGMNYVRAYLIADAKSANPRHTIFKKIFDFYDLNRKSADTDTLNIASGFWTVFIPTDDALQYAIDYPEIAKDPYTGQKPAALLFNLNNLEKYKSNPKPDGANWVDSCIYFMSAYFTKSGSYPDDGLSALYEMSEAWDGMKGTTRNAPKEYLVNTICKITDHDKLDANGKTLKPWDSLLSGAYMSGYVAKTGDGNKLQYYARPYTQGVYEVVKAINACDISNDFDNTIVREQGQSNIMAPNCLIHSLNGFVIYKIDDGNKQRK